MTDQKTETDARLTEVEWDEVYDAACRFYDAGEIGLRRDTYAPDLRASMESILRERMAQAWDAGVSAGQRSDVSVETQPGNPYHQPDSSSVKEGRRG